MQRPKSPSCGRRHGSPWTFARKRSPWITKKSRSGSRREQEAKDREAKRELEKIQALSAVEQARMAADLQKTEIFKGMSEGQILALMAKDSPDVAKAIGPGPHRRRRRDESPLRADPRRQGVGGRPPGAGHGPRHGLHGPGSRRVPYRANVSRRKRSSPWRARAWTAWPTWPWRRPARPAVARPRRQTSSVPIATGRFPRARNSAIPAGTSSSCEHERRGVMAVHVEFRKAGFQVLVALLGGILPQAADKKFSTHIMCVFLPFQASWHNHPISTNRDILAGQCWPARCVHAD